MKRSFLISLVALTYFSNTLVAQNALPTWSGRWTEKQSCVGATEWLFQGKNKFAKISYWSAAELGGRIHKGSFEIDSLNNVVLLKFEKIVDVTNDVVRPTTHQEEWNIITLNDEEMVLSRKIVFSTDKPNKAGDKEHIYVRLKRTTKLSYSNTTEDAE